MMPMLSECDRFYFDAEAAERPIRFAAKFLRHFEGRLFAGQPFTFLPWQADITRALFGWKRRADGLRRFREAYILTAKGSGKTPWLSAIGMYMLLADNEPGAQVMSCATDFQQANLTLDAAKTYIKSDVTLAKLCAPKQFEIRAPKNSKWSVMSGTAEGRHGFRPSCLLMDEAHEWPNGKLFNNLTANTTKRQQPLTLVATNAGESQACFAWKLHSRAVKVLQGASDDTTLLPVIYETPLEMNWQSEEAARVANPSLGTITTFESLAPELAKAREDPEAEARYRRLYLSQWAKIGAGQWLDLSQWDACESDAQPPDDAPLYVGVDLAEFDDLCAAVELYPTPDRLYVRAHFWVPFETAARYEEKHSIPYLDWAAAGHITLLEEPTINADVHRKISDHILALKSGKRRLKAVCYDRYRADATVANLEAAGVTCVPIGQGFSLSPACSELQKRLKESVVAIASKKETTIAIATNPVLRFCAENAEAKTDDRGNTWVAKPGGKGKYAGLRWRKVDGITALATALVEARKFAFPKTNAWKGSVTRIERKA